MADRRCREWVCSWGILPVGNVNETRAPSPAGRPGRIPPRLRLPSKPAGSAGGQTRMRNGSPIRPPSPAAHPTLAHEPRSRQLHEVRLLAAQGPPQGLPPARQTDRKHLREPVRWPGQKSRVARPRDDASRICLPPMLRPSDKGQQSSSNYSVSPRSRDGASAINLRERTPEATSKSDTNKAHASHRQRKTRQEEQSAVSIQQS